jgi:DNA-binding LacI/PurR family transcriptional regulator
MVRQSQSIAMLPTLKDIARESGLDVSTVSRALSGGYGVRELTREKVLAIAEKLNYHPNLVARGLVTGRSHTIGLLINDIRNPYFADVVRGAEDAAYAAGLDMVLCNSDLDPVKQMKYFRSFREKRVSGILTSSVAALKRNQIDELASYGTPIVVFDEAPRSRHLSTVLADNFQGGELAGKYLMGLGHTAIAHLTGPRAVGNLAQRHAGFVKALKTSPKGVTPILIRGLQTHRGGYDMAKKLFSRHPRVTAVFAANDVTAFGVLQAVLEKGMVVPDDVSLIGFDDVQFAAITHPPLTTVEQPKYEMGRAGVEILLRQSQGNAEHVPEHRRFGVRLIERKSCRAK